MAHLVATTRRWSLDKGDLSGKVMNLVDGTPAASAPTGRIPIRGRSERMEGIFTPTAASFGNTEVRGHAAKGGGEAARTSGVLRAALRSHKRRIARGEGGLW